MDEYQHFERLDADGDFEGGQFINGEFFYRTKRKAAQQTEEDRIYGVFQGSDDEEDGFSSKRRRRRDHEDGASLHKPVEFVSKTVIQTTLENTEDVLPAPNPLPQQEVQPPLGLGRTGLGLAAAYGDDDEDEDDGGAATGLARKVQMSAEQRRKAEAAKRDAESTRVRALKADPKLAQFENHSKGIGSKLLRAMGWKPGEGLGAKRDGIAKPLEASLRPKKAGLGATGAAEPSLAPRPEPAAAAAAAMAAGPQESQFKAMWKQNRRDKVKPAFKTAEQLLQEQQAAAAGDGGGRSAAAAAPTMTILDMTGPQTRVVTNLETLGDDSWAATAAADEPFPELQHNMKLLEEMAEAEIVQADAKLRHARDTALLLQDDVVRLERDSEACEAELARATTVLDAMRIVDQRGASVPLDELQAAYEGLQSEFPEEYRLFDVPAIALGQALPLLKAGMAGWDPLAQPAEPWLPTLEGWKRLLEGRQQVLASSDPAHPGEPFSELLLAAMFDPLRRAVIGAWTPHQPEALLLFFDAWAAVMPRAVASHFLVALVMPRLRQAVNAWNPLTDALPAHKWLHPWLPYLTEELKELYPTLRGKLAAALAAWQPWDYSAYEVLKPWHRVWDKRDWDALLARCVVPPLRQAMHSMLNLNPLEKDDRPCEWAMAWADVMPLHLMASIYEDGFFPKLHQVLHFWLIHNPKYEEVWAWFEAYKKTRLPPNLADDDRIRFQLNVAFRAINDAQNGRPFPFGYPVVVTPASEGAAPLQFAPPAPAPVAEVASIKELLAVEAAEHGLTFMPRIGRMVAGLQVHALGKLSVVIDNQNNLLKAFMGDRWVPMSIDDVIRQAQQRT